MTRVAVTVSLVSLLLTRPFPVCAEPGSIFVDRTAELGVDFRHFNGMSGELYFVEMMGPGGALFDYDNDGDLDLYLVQGQMLGEASLDQAVAAAAPQLPLRDHLYRNDLVVSEDGTRRFELTDVTEASGIDAGGYGMGAAVGDYDNDGWLDLYVTNFGPNQLWHNNGPGDGGGITFTEVTDPAGAGDAAWSIAASFIDFDNDGWLDLYVGNYVSFSLVDHKFCPAPTGGRDYCGPLAYSPLGDRLLHNRGRPAKGLPEENLAVFGDVTAESGLEAAANGMGVVSGDFDGNGWPDLYVTNDAQANQLWLNQGPDAEGRFTFVDDALLAGCAFNLDGQPEGSMGVAAGDVDADGREDLLITHLIHETNTLYLDRGGAAFLDATTKSGLGPPSWLYTGFGVALLDYDNDGWLDALAANGAVRLFDRDLLGEAEAPGAAAGKAGLEGWTLAQPNQLFHHRGVGDKGTVGFDDVSGQAGAAFRVSDVSRGVSQGDLDNDGDVDVVIHNNRGPVRILVNQAGIANHWLGLRLVGDDRAPRDMLGAEAEIRRTGRLLRRRVRSDGSYASSSDPRLLFGLGSDASPATVRVTWPGGGVEEFRAVPADRYTTLRKGQGQPVEIRTPRN